ncbi:MBL fold metallo-hydrolase [Ectobacillus antri]|jgi:glyoxylase-like metal-dependent hydrolase (beta-lactamase superfamily II)|uniref:MBL fold metallo-hydrolase n=1 Tax=Ectobacillus antri TaxID=2486280 RepID=A0ABT6H2H2_9BACI|nr:MBL fold metallo-hydrolase [Ectobacillus antri]MDG4656288.1 MBL fold metallo-hydrolase [Ectobacillus antri]MDG5752963.1 MBL fold metallo-hydrolase [Ectobacillus antri]
MTIPKQVGEQLYLIDDYDLNRLGRTGTYVLLGEYITLIETCASPSVPHIEQGLSALGINKNDIAYIIVTHVHLDHAGAAGLMIERCPNAKLLVHPRGARHLIDPTKLIAGAKAVYGDQFDALFSPILPVPSDRVITMENHATLRISPKRLLTFYDTPGHANHHISIHDSLTNGIFTGDTIGIYYSELMDCGVEFYLPSTSPTQFNPEAMLQSLHRIHKLGVHHIYFSHFGVSSHVRGVCRQIETWLPHFVETGKDVLRNEPNPERAANKISAKLLTDIRTYLTAQGVPASHTVYEILQLDINVCAMGIVHYLLTAEATEKA